MLTKVQNSKGFTLIELLIVVAIIGILAAVAIPQFSAYRIKAFNSAAAADLKNAKTSEESLYSDNQTYGFTESVILANATGTGGPGNVLVGPLAPATTVAGACISGTTAALAKVGVGFGISNGVILAANSSGTAALPGVAYNIVAKHSAGTRIYGAESASTAIVFVDSPAWAGKAMSANTGAPSTGFVNTPTAVIQTPVGTAGSGTAPYDTWTAM